MKHFNHLKSYKSVESVSEFWYNFICAYRVSESRTIFSWAISFQKLETVRERLEVLSEKNVKLSIRREVFTSRESRFFVESRTERLKYYSLKISCELLLFSLENLRRQTSDVFAN